MEEIRMEDEKEISIADLIAEVLRRWKSILAVSAAAALIAGIITYAGGSADIRAAESDNTAASEQEAAKRSLSASQASAIEYLVQESDRFSRVFEKTSDLYQNSVLNDMDPDSLLFYRIEYTYSSANSDFIYSYENVLGEDEYKEIASIIGRADSWPYVSGLVRFYRPNDSAGADSSQVTISDSDVRTGSFYVIIQAETSEEAEEIADVVRGAVTAHTDLLKKAEPTLDVSEVEGKYVSELPRDSYRNDETQFDNLSTYRSIVNSLTDDEKTYYDYLISHNVSSGNNTEADISSSAAAAKTDNARNALKKGLIGLVAGWAVMVILYILAYVCTSSVKTADDLDQISHQPVLGILRSKEKRKGLDGAVNRLADRIAYSGNAYHQESQLPLIASRIARISGNNGAKSVYLLTDTASDDSRSLLEKLQEQKEAGGIRLVIGNPAVDTDLFESMKSDSVCVLIGTLKHSWNADLTQLMTISKETGSKLIGTVAIIE